MTVATIAADAGDEDAAVRCVRGGGPRLLSVELTCFLSVELTCILSVELTCLLSVEGAAD